MSQELFAAAQSGDAAKIKQLLAAGSDHAAADEVKTKSPQGWTALAKAAYNGDTERGYVEVIEVLHDAGAAIDEPIFFGITPLMLAAGGGDASVVEWLINHGANVQATNEGGRTARMMADDKFYVDVINLLHEAEQQLGVTVDGSCSSTVKVAKPQVVNLMKPTTH